MTKRLVGWFILLPLCLVLAVFALANRHMIEVRFDPLSAANPLAGPVEVPLFIVIYAMLIAGIVLGGLATWFTQGRQRREKRRWRRRTAELETERTRKSRRDGRNSDLTLIEGP